jgi:hypothetical protein
MNKNLEPVFKILLPSLVSAGIDYWAHGGISVAGCAGKFIRENRDIDIFVKEADFPKAKYVLESICNQNNYRLVYWDTGRLKLDVKIKKIERLSVIPIFLQNGKAVLKFWKTSEEYPVDVLTKVERNISGFRFLTPPDKYIKQLLKSYLKTRPDKRYKPKLKLDAEAILSRSEINKLYNT